ncbi:MAG: CooT family nickel-binding protein [Anaerolineales bacterium]
MCQATVFLDGEEIMRDVMLVEPLPEGIKLVAFFEPVKIIPAKILQIDLMKHRVFLESLKGETENERVGKTEGVDPALDRT